MDNTAPGPAPGSAGTVNYKPLASAAARWATTSTERSGAPVQLVIRSAGKECADPVDTIGHRVPRRLLQQAPAHRLRDQVVHADGVDETDAVDIHGRQHTPAAMVTARRNVVRRREAHAAAVLEVGRGDVLGVRIDVAQHDVEGGHTDQG